MILVTVGTEQFSFNRLMQWIDNLINQNLIKLEQEEVIIQYGSSTFVPNGVKGYSILQQADFLSLVKKARLIVAHCGEGTLDLLALVNKPFILVPRSHDFQEHVDDHQIELAQQLSKQGIPIATSQQDLSDFVINPFVAQLSTTPEKYYTQASVCLEQELISNIVVESKLQKLTKTVRQYLQNSQVIASLIG